MSDCPVCGPAGEEGPCLAHSAPLLTPPTPDPRERGVNYAAMMAARDENERDAARVVDAYLADHGVRWSPGAAQMAADLLALEALRAPAPSEAVAWQRCPVCDGHGYLGYPKGVAPGQSFFDSSTGNYPCHACNGRGALAAHPAPARGVTVLPSEALFGFMGWLTSREAVSGPFSAAQNATQAAYLVAEFCKSQGWEFPRDSFPKMLTNYPVAALTPDAEGGA